MTADTLGGRSDASGGAGSEDPRRSRLRAAVLSAAPPGAILALLERLSWSSQVEVVAIVLDGPSPVVSRGKYARGRGGLSRAGGPGRPGRRWSERLMGSPPIRWMNDRAHPEREGLSQRLVDLCAEREIPILFAAARRDETAAALRARSADIGLACGAGAIDRTLFSIPRLGTIGLRDLRGLESGSDSGALELFRHGGPIEVQVRSLARGESDGPPLASGQLPVEEHDVPESLAIKIEKLARDLLIEALGSVESVCLAHSKESAALPARHGERAGAVGSPAGPCADTAARTRTAEPAPTTSPASSAPAAEPPVSRSHASPAHMPESGRSGSAASASHGPEDRAARRELRHLLAGRFLAKRRVSARIRVRQALAAVYLYCGYVQLRNAWRRRSGTVPGVVINFHRVADNTAGHWMTLGTDDFDRYLAFIRRYYRVVSIQEMRRILASGSNREHLAAITLDDGYLECAGAAVAALERQGLPAAFFVCADLVSDGGELQHDRDRSFRGLRTMSGTLLRDVVGRGLEIGSHSATHADLRAASPEVLEREVVSSKPRIEEATGVAVQGLAVPFGTPAHCRPEVFAAARRAGYQYVLSHFDGVNFPGEEGYHLRRVRPPLDGLLTLHAVAEGWRGFSGLFRKASERILVGDRAPARSNRERQAASSSSRGA